MPLVTVSPFGKKGAYDMKKDVDAVSFFAKKKIVLLSFPGCFTPTCTTTHIPSFEEKIAEFRAKGAEVVGLVVNDPFIVKQFAESLACTFPFIADGSGKFTESLDAGIDLSDKALGYRGKRFTSIIDNGEVKVVNMEEDTKLTGISGVENVLAQLG